MKQIPILFFILIAINIGYARERSTVTTLSYGIHSITASSQTIEGSKIALSIRVPFDESWSYNFSLSDAAASGFYQNSDGTVKEITAQTTGVSGGAHWQMDIGEHQNITPFVSAAFLVQQYKFDFSYEGSETGKTSGVGYGPMILLGTRVRVGRTFSFIPSYYYETLYYDSEKKGKKTATSSGVQLSLVIGF